MVKITSNDSIDDKKGLLKGLAMTTTKPIYTQLNFVIISVENLEESLRFYTDTIGLNHSPIEECRENTTKDFWSVPSDTNIRQVLCFRDNSEIGQILLIEFSNKEKTYIKPDQDFGMIRGLWNINFYVENILTSVQVLKSKGYCPWTDPVLHKIGENVGSPIEVILDGPDRIAINLVQLPKNSENQSIQKICDYFQSNGTTRLGFTEVVTTSHCVQSTADAALFYQQVLGMDVMFQDTLKSPESNLFLRRPYDGQTQITFLQGSHHYGKVVLSEPLNYEIPNTIDIARPPNIGYFAQGFFVDSLDRATQACKELNVVLWQNALLTIGDYGDCNSLLVQCPGSDALIALFEKK